MNAQSLRDMAIVSMQEGARLGRVDQPLLDLNDRRLWGVRARSGSGAFLLPFSAIQSIGSDAITVPSSDATQLPRSDDQATATLDLPALGSLKVVDQTGAFLGHVTEVDIDSSTGAITSLAVHRGGLFGLGGTILTIRPDAVVAYGSDLLTVTAATSPTAEAPSEQGAEPPDTPSAGG